VADAFRQARWSGYDGPIGRCHALGEAVERDHVRISLGSEMLRQAVFNKWPCIFFPTKARRTEVVVIALKARHPCCLRGMRLAPTMRQAPVGVGHG
jgi:hypothetical protein